MKCLKAIFGFRAPDKIGTPQPSVHVEPSPCLGSSEDPGPTSADDNALDFVPPACPPLQSCASELRMRYCNYIAQVIPLEIPVGDEQLQVAGQRLARELAGQAIDLSYSKKYEFSPDIYWLIQSAAIVSLFAEGPQSEAFAHYRNKVEYYRRFNLTIARVEAFEQYVSSR